MQIAPLRSRLELNGGFEHRQRSRVRRRVGAASLAEHRVNFGHCLDHPIGALEQLRGFSRRKAGQSAGHVEQIAFVERRKKLAAEPGERDQCCQKHQPGYHQGGLGAAHDPVEAGSIGAGQHPVDRIALLARNLSPDQPPHQHRHQRYRKDRGGGHGVRLGERKRREQPSFLRLQSKHRQERQGDDQ